MHISYNDIALIIVPDQVGEQGALKMSMTKHDQTEAALHGSLRSQLSERSKVLNQCSTLEIDDTSNKSPPPPVAEVIVGVQVFGAAVSQVEAWAIDNDYDDTDDNARVFFTKDDGGSDTGLEGIV
ncbi:unnamed protein product [Prorocentrum cordatum]|uniref:Subtilisin n=1 Tax=Prorocentrum cordatum TaxID=2364126 RepID=A0ABN9X3S0_9DINO|nr:unnamed protein product [Polarella glacialis]